MTQVVEEKLAPFSKRVLLKSVNELSNVKVQFPDFLKLLSLNTEEGQRVRRVRHEQIHSAINSVIDPPSATNPYYYEFDGGFRLITGDDDIDRMVMTYVRKPAEITWPFTIVNDVPTFDSGSSSLVNPQWRDQEINEIIFIQLGFIGINLKDSDLVRVSQTAKMQGE
jgi:hypothetical protein